MDKAKLLRLYPRFGIAPDERIFPIVAVPRNYRELMPLFYQQKRKEKVEYFVDELRQIRILTDIRLQWREKLGLTNINLGTHFGFDLDERACEFQEHNLDGEFSLIGSAIAQKYVLELLKCK